jgi:ribosome biogenesis GTPase
MTAEIREGLVIASYGRRGVLSDANGIQHRYVLKGRKLRPVCGDLVNWQKSDQSDDALVTTVLARKNALVRADARGRPETLAANLTCLAIVLAPQPTPDFYIADRYLCAAEILDVPAVLVWNKSDIDAMVPAELSAYEELGYRVLRCSAATGKGVTELLDTIGDGTAMLVGQSGVGKSSLINQLAPNAAVATGKLSDASREGKHTTTASFMHRLTTGGRLIDSPGVRDFAPSIDDVKDVQTGFVEIRKLAHGCRFGDCQHLREPDCAVKQAVESGRLDARRYASYKRLRNSAAQLKDQQSPG